VNENFVVAENLVNITNTNFDSEINAKVSPDGTTIVYSNNTGGGSQLETRPIGGGAPTIIATGFVENFAPEISPDGTMIAFSGFNGARTDIYTIPIGGGATTNVTNGLGVGNGFPTWAPEPICELRMPMVLAQKYLSTRLSIAHFLI
jgi:Tol biopolymer transport system component